MSGTKNGSITLQGYDENSNPREIVLTVDNGAVFVSNLALSGTLQTQTVIALNATAQTIIFDPPVKAAIIKVRHGGSTADQEAASVLCFDAPNTGVRDDWLNVANTAPRVSIGPADGVIGVDFNGALVSSIGLKALGVALDIDVDIGGIS